MSLAAEVAKKFEYKTYADYTLLQKQKYILAGIEDVLPRDLHPTGGFPTPDKAPRRVKLLEAAEEHLAFLLNTITGSRIALDASVVQLPDVSAQEDGVVQRLRGLLCIDKIPELCVPLAQDYSGSFLEFVLARILQLQARVAAAKKPRVTKPSVRVLRARKARHDITPREGHIPYDAAAAKVMKLDPEVLRHAPALDFYKAAVSIFDTRTLARWKGFLNRFEYEMFFQYSASDGKDVEARSPPIYSSSPPRPPSPEPTHTPVDISNAQVVPEFLTLEMDDHPMSVATPRPADEHEARAMPMNAAPPYVLAPQNGQMSYVSMEPNGDFAAVCRLPGPGEGVYAKPLQIGPQPQLQQRMMMHPYPTQHVSQHNWMVQPRQQMQPMYPAAVSQPRTQFQTLPVPALQFRPTYVPHHQQYHHHQQQQRQHWELQMHAPPATASAATFSFPQEHRVSDHHGYKDYAHEDPGCSLPDFSYVDEEWQEMEMSQTEVETRRRASSYI